MSHADLLNQLRAAVEARNYAALEALLPTGAASSFELGAILSLAIGFGDMRSVQLLLDAGATVETEELGLHSAATYFSVNPILRLLLERFDPNIATWDGITALFWAVGSTGGPAATELLLSAGADPNHRNEDGETPIMWAADGRNWNDGKVIQLLLDAGADPNAFNDTPGTVSRALHSASRRGYYTNISVLLHGGADPNGLDRNRETPLYIALEEGHSHVAELLLTHGADIGSLGTKGRIGKTLRSRYSALLTAMGF